MIITIGQHKPIFFYTPIIDENFYENQQKSKLNIDYKNPNCEKYTITSNQNSCNFDSESDKVKFNHVIQI